MDYSRKWLICHCVTALFCHLLLKVGGARFKKIKFSFDSLQIQLSKLVLVTFVDIRASRRQVDFQGGNFLHCDPREVGTFLYKAKTPSYIGVYTAWND